MSGRGEWVRVSRMKPCAICGRGDWCVTARDGSAAICARTESLKRAGEAGWLHRLHNAPTTRRSPVRRAVVRTDRQPERSDLAELAARWHKAAVPFGLIRLASELGVDRGALLRLQMGWAAEHDAWTFPMKRADGAIVGVRLRLSDGCKLSVRGGREGCFIPSDLRDDGTLFVAEGATDAAALLSLRFAAIGRPSCTGGTAIVAELARGRDVAIIADGDDPGMRGAEALARVLVLVCPRVRLMSPPAGVKDAREWVRSGATREDILAAVDAAEPVARFSAAALAAVKGGAR